jgi:glutathione peroxidase-family protein
MITLFFIIGSFFYGHSADSTFNPFTIQVREINGDTLQLLSFAGKPTVVYEFNAGSPSTAQLQALDTLYRNSSGQLNVIAIPVQDFSAVSATDSLQQLISQAGISYSIADTGYAQKSAATQQPLLQWITHVELNGHFDDDINEAGKIFVISATGTLYGSLDSTFSCNGPEIQDILNNPPSY